MKTRLDKLLIKNKIVKSRQRAVEIIERGLVEVDGEVIKKASRQVDINSKIKTTGTALKWVSRAGLKLEKAIKHWDIKIENKICLDLGASTGGFCDVLLEEGAKKIYAIEVGHNQLADKIRNNPKIINIEQTDARNLNKNIIPEQIEILTADLSFISLEKVLPSIYPLLKDSCQLILLFKPQFEVGKKNLKKGGFVKSNEIREEQVDKFKKFLKKDYKKIKTLPSPIKGKQGNTEYLISAQNSI